MTPVDWIIVAFAVLMALWGYAQGLLAGALALAGFGIGALVGSRLGPLLLDEGQRSPYAPLFALLGALLLGGLLASILELLGFSISRRMGEGLGVLDGIGGAVLVACLGLGIAWIAGAVALQTPGARELRKPIQRSAILRELNSALPPSGPILNALARFDPVPEIDGPAPRVGPPNTAIARDPQVRGAAASVVRILGTACGLGVQGSGWVAGDGIVVTNAHVVAGQDDTTVQLGGEGDRLGAEAVLFDPGNDLAILSVPDISGTPALQLAPDPESGTSAAILGFPENGPYDVRPGRLGETSTFSADDAYGRGPLERSITSLRGVVRSGNSGGPMVDGRGRVVTTIFAASVAPGNDSGYGVPNAIARGGLRRVGGPVDTGPCAR